VAEQEKAPFYKKWWFWAIVAIIVIFAMTNTGDDADNEADSPNTDEAPNEEIAEDAEENITEEAPEEEENNETTPPAEPDEEEAEEESEQATGNTIGAGTYAVGVDMEPGVYRTTGNVSYWERLSGFSGEFEEIIANGNPSGPFVIEIMESDKGFKTQGSGEWVKIDLATYEGENLTEFGDGLYLVGKDIAPGTYKSSGGSSYGGYWERLSGLSGQFDDIIANGNPEGSTIVEVKEGDVAFSTSGNLTWTKIE
jgi:hypothetical protein